MIAHKRLRKGNKLGSPDEVYRCLQTLLLDSPYEVFGTLLLDTQHRLIAFDELFRGTIDSASVYPREVIKHAIEHNAAAVILVHNHPSGDPEPSDADRRITQRLKVALGLVDIRVLDHACPDRQRGAGLFRWAFFIFWFFFTKQINGVRKGLR